MATYYANRYSRLAVPTVTDDKMSAVNLQQVHDYLIEIAHKAGEIIVNATPTAAGSSTKSNSVDLVTEIDQAVEKMVFTSLRERYPDFDCIYHLLPVHHRMRS